MIELSSAFGGVEDTTFVHLEDSGVSFDGDGGWSVGDGSLELINGASYDVLVVGGEDLTLGEVSLALLVNTSVWVVSLKLLGGTLSILEGILLPSTAASVGSGIAINELLLGEGDKFTGGLEVGTFDGAGGRERPA